MRFLIFLFTLFALPAAAQNAPAVFDASKYDVTFGVFCAQRTGGAEIAPDTESGTIELYRQVPDFRWKTNRVPAVLGMSFGVKMRPLDGLGMENIAISLTHPPFIGSGTTHQQYETGFDDGSYKFNAYTFDLPKEQVAGTWVFEAHHNGERLYRVEFHVYDPVAVPKLEKACERKDLYSGLNKKPAPDQI